jgi:DNA-binding transcriptional MerR regulator
MSEKRYLRTVDLARAVGVSVQQVRNYEAAGFLPPAPRSAAGYRLYTRRHLAAIETTRAMIAGYGWQQTRAIMETVHRGDLDAALALVDARHAELHRQRGQVEEMLTALRAVTVQPGTRKALPDPRGLRVGAAARRVGVRVSALRFWEQEGLLEPRRDKESRYRLYDEQQLQRLQVVALLRQVGYRFDTIRVVLAELAQGKPEKALEAVERRREDLTRASRAGIEATVAFWGYASTTETADSESERPSAAALDGRQR